MCPFNESTVESLPVSMSTLNRYVWSTFVHASLPVFKPTLGEFTALSHHASQIELGGCVVILVWFFVRLSLLWVLQ